MSAATNSWKVSRPDGYLIRSESSGTGKWLSGVVRTRHGFVSIYSDESATNLSIIMGGCEFNRVYRRGYRPRAIVTLASKFAEEIASS